MSLTPTNCIDEVAQQLQTMREAMPETFAYLVMTEELSRMPTEAEMDAGLRLIERRMRDGKWNDTTQEQAVLLCAVADITTTLEIT